MDTNKIEAWKQEEKFAFKGWDFSHLDGRWEGEQQPWAYRQMVLEQLKPDTKLLDMGTGGGEFLLSLGHEPKLCSVTEGWLPNLKLCQETLEPLGVTVKFVEDKNSLDFADSSFHLVTNRHDAFLATEVARVLKPGGVFITQQVGRLNDKDLIEKLTGRFEPEFPEADLAYSIRQLEEAHMQILHAQESFTPIRFFDVGALVFFAKIIEWEFHHFSVEACLPALLKADEEIAKKGCIEGTEHRFVIIAQKPLP
ncbi:MAG: class I SAM-dependent methyltransferase [Anaerolineaceae bacterium]|nr:class I SAM-dependent methyltransferase [Anaerolineaceae bacterium]